MTDPTRIADRYDVLRPLGSGGTGTVWLCRDSVLGREVALKRVGALPGESHTELRRAFREARSAAALGHPNAVSVFDVLEDDTGTPWLVMEFVDGETLAERLRRDGPMDPREVAEIGARLASALARAHDRGVIHRDVKPGNVLIDRAGRPRISDFGIARRYGDDLTQTGFVTGTPSYLSPELARGGDPDPASDVWALGATLYEAVEGRKPYEPRGNPIATLQVIATEPSRAPERAGPLAPALEAMMDVPERRWDMATATEELARVAGGDEVARERAAASALPLGTGGSVHWNAPTDRLGRPRHGRPDRGRRRRAAAVLGGLLVLLALLGSGAWLLTGTGSADAPAAAPTTSPPTGGSATTTPSTTRPSSSTRPSTSSSTATRSSSTTSSTTAGTTTSTTAPSRRSTSSTSPSTTSTSRTPSSTRSSTTTAPPAPSADARLASFLRSYFATVTSDPDATWDRLTPRMQVAAGGYQGYVGFWRGISRASTSGIDADASAGTATLTLVYTRQDGSTSTETHRLRVVPAGRSFRIDGEENL